MASLKEIKGRIASVKSTQKITSAMKMIASAKLRKVQYQAERFLPYGNRLAGMLNDLLSAAASEDFRFHSPFAQTRKVKRAGIVVLSSDTGLCGAFNSNILRLLATTLETYRSQNCETLVYPAGKKAEAALQKWPFPLETPGSFGSLGGKPHWEGAQAMANRLAADFLANKIDRVGILYNHCKSMAVQQPVAETFLPLVLPERPEPSPGCLAEPDRESLIQALIPQFLQSKLYAILLDSAAAEQAARTMAMQIATDNIDDLLDELRARLNKQRQQAISNEILDLIGGGVNSEK